MRIEGASKVINFGVKTSDPYGRIAVLITPILTIPSDLCMKQNRGTLKQEKIP